MKIPAGAKTLLKNPKSIIYQNFQGGLTKCAIQIQGAVKRNVVIGWGMGHKSRLPLFLGKLNRSINISDPVGLKLKVGSSMEGKNYAEIQEYGGDIRPVNAKALFIPMSRLGQKIGPKKGGDDRLKYGRDFIFKQLVHIKPKNYFARGMASSSDKVIEIINAMLAKMGKDAGVK